MVLQTDLNNKGNGRGMTLWESKDYFGSFVNLKPSEQAETRKTKEFERAKIQYLLYDYSMRKILYEKLFEKLEGLI